MRQPRTWRLLLASLALAAGVAACAQPAAGPSAGGSAPGPGTSTATPAPAVDAAADHEGSQPTVSTMVEGVLTACVAPTPDVAESVDGDWEGFDVAVLDGVAGQLGLELELVPSSFDEIASGVALNGGTCEVAAAAVVDDDALDAVVRPSAPYRTVHRLVVTAGAVPAAVAPEELTGRVGVEEGGAATDAVDVLTAAEVVPYPSREDLTRALRAGVVDAALVAVTARAELETALGRELSLLATVPTEDETVLLLPLGADDEFLEAVDGALAALRDEGALTALRDQWLRG